MFLCMILVSCTSTGHKTVATKPDASNKCAELADLNLPHAVITEASFVPAGEYLAPDGVNYNVPDFCRVQIVSVPTKNSHITIEVWMPTHNWNGRYYQLGTGGFAGHILYGPLAASINKGNAVAMTDSGHRDSTGLNASWALGEPEKIIDYGYRSLKETTDNAKWMLSNYYGRPAQYAYFSGCSNGGRQAMMAAYRYPQDWHGILIGAPGNDFIRGMAVLAGNYNAFWSQPGAQIPQAKLPAIQKAALASCTADAQLVNGVAGDPRFCRFDPSVMLCTGNDNNQCLTTEQVGALKKVYDGARDPQTAQRLYPGLAATMESEPGWANFAILGAEPPTPLMMQYQLPSEFFRHMVFDKPQWDIRNFEIDKDIRFARTKNIAGQALSDVIGTASPNLEALRNQRAKVIVYHGWGDAIFSPVSAIGDYERSAKKMGGMTELQKTSRLFMVPGMLHCRGGPGASAFGQDSRAPALRSDRSHDITKALEAWVEKDIAPETIIATKYVDNRFDQGVDFTRPLCPYPKVAVYKGAGDKNLAKNFECKVGTITY